LKLTTPTITPTPGNPAQTTNSTEELAATYSLLNTCGTDTTVSTCFSATKESWEKKKTSLKISSISATIVIPSEISSEPSGAATKPAPENWIRFQAGIL